MMEKNAIYHYDKFICSGCGKKVEPRPIPCPACGDRCPHPPEHDYTCPDCGSTLGGHHFNTWERAANARKLRR